jgi:hypothetical protein
MIPFEMLTVEKYFKRNVEFCDWNFINDKKEFELHCQSGIFELVSLKSLN